MHRFTLALQSAARLVAIFAVALAASQARAQNFTVHGYGFSTEFLQQAADEMERQRQVQAEAWLGYTLPNWDAPCEVTLKRTGENSSGGGATSFVVDQGKAQQFTGTWLGTEQTLLKNIIPHEVVHTVLVTHFRNYVPRWLDEGAATYVETPEMQLFQQQQLVHCLRSGRGIPTSNLVAFREYPKDVLAFYAQAISQTRFLIELKGKREFVPFVELVLQIGPEAALRQAYGLENLNRFQEVWLSWVKAGSPAGYSVSYGPCQWDPYSGWSCPNRQSPRTYQVQPSAPVAPARAVPAAAPPVVTSRPPAVETSPLVKITPTPPTSPANRCTCGADCKCCTCKAEPKTLPAVPCPPGPPGVKGDKGDKGDPATIDYAIVVSEVIKRLPATEVVFQGAGEIPDKVQRVAIGGRILLPATHVQNFDRNQKLIDEESYPLATPIKLRHGVLSKVP